MDSDNRFFQFFDFIWFLIKQIFSSDTDIPQKIGSFFCLLLTLSILALLIIAVITAIQWTIHVFDSWFRPVQHTVTRVTYQEKRTDGFAVFPFIFSSEECFLAFDIEGIEYTFTTDIDDFRFCKPGKNIRVEYVVGRNSGKTHIRSVAPLKNS